MGKIVIQGLIALLLFFMTWFVLAKIDWMAIFKVEKTTDRTEEKLGELFYEIFKNAENENKDPFVIRSVDSIVTKICLANKIDRDLIKVHIFEKDEINAFALPNGHLVIYSDLIISSDNQEELSGVICHEIAHIQLNHVMRKLSKEVGLSALISMTTGNGGAEIIKKTAKMLSSSAFDRNLEKEADIKAVDYLVKAKLNPVPFANFLDKLSEEGNLQINYLTWISTHPESKERAEYIMEKIKDTNTSYEPILTTTSWEALKERLKKLE